MTKLLTGTDLFILSELSDGELMHLRNGLYGSVDRLLQLAKSNNMALSAVLVKDVVATENVVKTKYPVSPTEHMRSITLSIELVERVKSS